MPVQQVSLNLFNDIFAGYLWPKSAQKWWYKDLNDNLNKKSEVFSDVWEEM